jgi:hypothetical protein
VTVILADRPAVCACDVRGGGPGTRETDALEPEGLVEAADAVVFSGGSVFGLAAADGVAAWLAVKGAATLPGADPSVPGAPIAPRRSSSTWPMAATRTGGRRRPIASSVAPPSPLPGQTSSSAGRRRLWRQGRNAAGRPGIRLDPHRGRLHHRRAGGGQFVRLGGCGRWRNILGRAVRGGRGVRRPRLRRPCHRARRLGRQQAAHRGAHQHHAGLYRAQRRPTKAKPSVWRSWPRTAWPAPSARPTPPSTATLCSCGDQRPSAARAKGFWPFARLGACRRRSGPGHARACSRRNGRLDRGPAVRETTPVGRR